MTTAFCGVAGFLGGEIVSTFIMGAGISKVATISVKASQAAAKVMAKIPGVAHAAELGVNAAKTAAKGIGVVGKAAVNVTKAGWDAFMKSPSAVSVFSHVAPYRMGFSMAKEDFKFAAKTIANTRTAKVVKIPLSLVKGYFALMDKAGKCGFELGSKPWLLGNPNFKIGQPAMDALSH